MPISKEIIREIKSRVDIASEIGNYVHSLRKSGKNWIGLCPFHNDKNPSFVVSSEHGTYNCYACGERGDIFSFVQKTENCTFAEAVVSVGRKVGIDVRYENDGTDYSKKSEIIGFNERIVKVFSFFLNKTAEAGRARQYVMSRRLTPETANQFRLGYAPMGFGRLEQMCRKKGFSPEFLVSTGLFKQTDNGGIRAMFFDRLMFPIINYKNEVVGFGGRTLDPDGKPKYINTPETDVYKKHDNLYGIHLSREFIQQKRRAYLVEGYMDVIACYSHGLKNVAAPCGTAVTKQQINLLKRYCDEIVFLLDGDEAGMKGAARGLFQTADFDNLDCSVLVLPNDMDPDDYFKQNSVEDFYEFEKQRTPALDFLVFYAGRGADINNISELMRVLDYLYSFIVLWSNEIVRDKLLDRTANLLNINVATVKSEFKKYVDSRHSYKMPDNDAAVSVQNRPMQNAPAQKLSDRAKTEIAFMVYLSECTGGKEILNRCSFHESDLDTDIGRKMFHIIMDNEPDVAKKILIDVTENEEVKNYINDTIFKVGRLIIQEAKDDNHINDGNIVLNEKLISDNVYDRIYEIKNYHLRKKSAELTKKIKFGEMYKDSSFIKELQEEKIVIQNELDNLAAIKKLKGGAESNGR